MKYLFLSTTSRTVRDFRQCLIKKLIVEGNSVTIVCGDSVYAEEIKSWGVNFYNLRLNNRSLNPFNVKKYIKEVKNIVLNLKPDRVLTFMAKPNTYGVFGASRGGAKNIYCFVEGLGNPFANDSFKWKLIRIALGILYKRSFKKASAVFFLQHEDRDELIKRRYLKWDRCKVIDGIGVDIKKFAFEPIWNRSRFVLAARLIKTKGIIEYCEAATIVKAKYPEAEFFLLGEEGEITGTEIEKYSAVTYLGLVKDVREAFRDAAVYVLPSYREGIPMSTMEAMATGRAILTTSVPGCKETVIDGLNGFKVPVKDVDALVEKMIYFIDHPTETERMGKESRVIAESRFNADVVNKAICVEIEKCARDGRAE